MFTTYQGEAYALLAAICWAGALVFFKLSGQHLSPLPLNLFKNVVAVLLMLTTVWMIPSQLDAVRGRPWEQYVILGVSGILGIALADTVFFYSLNRVGVGLMAIIECTYSPLVIFFSTIMLKEIINLGTIVGATLVIGAVVIASPGTTPVSGAGRVSAGGIALGVAAMSLMAFGIVLAKPILDTHGFPVIWAALIRLGGGTLALVLILLMTGNWRGVATAFRPGSTWRVSLPAALLGSYLSMLFWVAGFKYARASTAGILNQTSTVFAILLATLVLREPFTRRKFVAIVLALLGVLVMTTLGPSARA